MSNFITKLTEDKFSDASFTSSKSRAGKALLTKKHLKNKLIGVGGFKWCTEVGDGPKVRRDWSMLMNLVYEYIEKLVFLLHEESRTNFVYSEEEHIVIKDIKDEDTRIKYAINILSETTFNSVKACCSWSKKYRRSVIRLQPNLASIPFGDKECLSFYPESNDPYGLKQCLPVIKGIIDGIDNGYMDEDLERWEEEDNKLSIEEQVRKDEDKAKRSVSVEEFDVSGMGMDSNPVLRFRTLREADRYTTFKWEMIDSIPIEARSLGMTIGEYKRKTKALDKREWRAQKEWLKRIDRIEKILGIDKLHTDNYNDEGSDTPGPSKHFKTLDDEDWEYINKKRKEQKDQWDIISTTDYDDLSSAHKKYVRVKNGGRSYDHMEYRKDSDKEIRHHLNRKYGIKMDLFGNVIMNDRDKAKRRLHAYSVFIFYGEIKRRIVEDPGELYISPFHNPLNVNNVDSDTEHYASKWVSIVERFWFPAWSLKREDIFWNDFEFMKQVECEVAYGKSVEKVKDMFLEKEKNWKIGEKNISARLPGL